MKKKIIAVMMAVVAGIIIRVWLERSIGIDAKRSIINSCVVDTIVYVDTVRYIAPSPTETRYKGMQSVTISLADIVGKEDELPDIRAETTFGGICSDAEINDDEQHDSITLQLPIEQRLYHEQEYTAYVSGVYAKLDSIYLFPRRDVVTIQYPPKRWHIGLTAGYGLSLKGFQPYIGVGITYSIISF